MRQRLIEKLAVLLPRRNGVVVLTGNKRDSNADRPAMEEIIFQIERWCMENDIDNVLFITIPAGFDLKELDDKSMNEFGWFRK